MKVGRAAKIEWPGCLTIASDVVADILKCEDMLRQLEQWEGISVSTNG